MDNTLAHLGRGDGWACNKSKCVDSTLFSHLLDFTTQTHTIECNLSSLMHRSKETVSWHPGTDYIQKPIPFRFNRLYHTQHRPKIVSTHARAHTRAAHTVTAHEREANTDAHGQKRSLSSVSWHYDFISLLIWQGVMSLSGWLASLPGSTHTAPSLSSHLISALLSCLKTVYLLLSLSSTTGGVSARKLSIASLKKIGFIRLPQSLFPPPIFSISLSVMLHQSWKKKTDTLVRLSRRLCNYLLGHSFIDVHLLCFV